jgi:hypothetical protein
MSTVPALVVVVLALSACGGDTDEGAPRRHVIRP